MNFASIPKNVKVAALLTVIYPILMPVLMFRLYSHPANSNAWAVIGMLTPCYAFVAYLFLKRVGAIRWFSVVWVALGIWRGVSLQIESSSAYWDILLIVIFGWLVQVATIALLFTPDSNRYFRRKSGEPNPER